MTKKRTVKNQSLIRGQPAPSMLRLTSFTMLKSGQYLEQKLTDYFLTPPIRLRHFAVLHVLAHGEAETQQDLSEVLWIDRGTMAVLIKELLSVHLVKRSYHASDRRSYILSLTAAGLEYHREHRAVFEHVEREIFPSLTTRELAVVRKILGKAMTAVVQLDNDDE